MSSTLRRLGIVLLAAGSISTACGDEASPASPTDTAPLRSTETYGGTIGVGGEQFYSFTVTSAGTTDITLLSVRSAGVATSTLNTTLGLGLGTPAGTDCALSSAIRTTPGLTAQLTVSTSPSTYCVKVADVGNLVGAVDYTVRILHP
jgi:hypothetical protein